MQAMSRISRRLLVLACLAPASGCGDDGGSAGDAVVDVGTGGIAFEPLSEGASLRLIAGSQGGYHFVVNARMHDLLAGDPSMPNLLGNPLTSFSLVNAEGDRIDTSAPPYRLGYRDSDESPWLEMPSGRLLVVNQQLIDADPNFLDSLYGSEISLRVTVVDAKGDQGSDETTIRPERDPVSDMADAGPETPDGGPTGPDAGP